MRLEFLYIFGQKFLQLCDQHSAQFKDPQLVLSESQITTMCTQFRIDSKANIKRRELCATLHYYVNHRDEFHDAIENGMNAVMVKFKNPNDYNLTFRSVAFNGFLNELQIMIQFNNAAPNIIIDINASGTSKMTALHQAVRSQSVDKVKLLLTPNVLKNQKIALDSFSKEGKTPLHIAWEKDTRNLQIFEALLNAGAKPDVICEACPVNLMQTIITSTDSDATQFLDAIRQLHPNTICK